MPGPYKNGLYHPTRYAKGDEPHIDEKHDWCFLITPFSFLQGTAIMRCGEPVIAFIVFALIIFHSAEWNPDKEKYRMEIPESLVTVYSAIGTFYALLAGWRLSNSLGSHAGARAELGAIQGQLRRVNKYTCNYLVASGAETNLQAKREEIQRHVNILFLFMRQSLVESRCGFHPLSDVAVVLD